MSFEKLKSSPEQLQNDIDTALLTAFDKQTLTDLQNAYKEEVDPIKKADIAIKLSAFKEQILKTKKAKEEVRTDQKTSESTPSGGETGASTSVVNSNDGKGEEGGGGENEEGWYDTAVKWGGSIFGFLGGAGEKAWNTLVSFTEPFENGFNALAKVWSSPDEDKWSIANIKSVWDGFQKKEEPAKLAYDPALEQDPIPNANGKNPSENDVAKKDEKVVQQVVAGNRAEKELTKRASGTAYLDTPVSKKGLLAFKDTINSFHKQILFNKLAQYPKEQIGPYIKALTPREVWIMRKNLDHPSKANNYSAANLKKLMKTSGLLEIKYSKNEIVKFVEQALKKRGYGDSKLLFSKTHGQKPTTFNDEVLWIVSLLKQESVFKPFNVSHTGALGISQMTKGNYEGGELGGAFNPFGDTVECISKTIIHLEKNIQSVNNKTFKNIITAYNRGARGVNSGKINAEGAGYFPAIQKHVAQISSSITTV